MCGGPHQFVVSLRSQRCQKMMADYFPCLCISLITGIISDLAILPHQVKCSTTLQTELDKFISPIFLISAFKIGSNELSASCGEIFRKSLSVVTFPISAQDFHNQRRQYHKSFGYTLDCFQRSFLVQVPVMMISL